MSVIRTHLKGLIALSLTLILIGCQKDKEADLMGGLLLLLLLSGNNQAGMYLGMTDIPESIRSATSSASSGMSVNGQKLLVAGNSELEKMTRVFQPVRDSINLGRNVAYNVGALIINLKRYNPGTQVVQTNITWGEQPAKIRYQTDATFGADGRKLEVWWTADAAPPFTSKKAFELVFLDNNSDFFLDSEIKGKVWGRFKDEEHSTLGMMHSTFEKNPSTGVGFMSLIIEAAPDINIENAHMYIRNVNGVTSIDGTISIPNFRNPLSSGLDGSNGRAYVFSASGNDSISEGSNFVGKAVVQAAFPDGDSSDANPYTTANVNSIPEVFTDWLLGISGYVTLLNAAGCTLNAGSTASQLLTCMNTIRVGNPAAFTDIYYVPNIQLPAFYKRASNQSASLVAVGQDPDGSYGVYQANLLNGIRSTGSANYAADFLPNSVRTLSILNGTNVPPAAVWTDGNSSAPF